MGQKPENCRLRCNPLSTAGRLSRCIFELDQRKVLKKASKEVLIVGIMWFKFDQIYYIPLLVMDFWIWAFLQCHFSFPIVGISAKDFAGLSIGCCGPPNHPISKFKKKSESRHHDPSFNMPHDHFCSKNMGATLPPSPKILGLQRAESPKLQMIFKNCMYFFDLWFGFYTTRKYELMYHKAYMPTNFLNPHLNPIISHVFGAGKGGGVKNILAHRS